MPDPVLRSLGRKRWHNWHDTVRHPISDLYDIHNPPGGVSTLAGLNATSAAIEGLIAKARTDSVRLRAKGSGWSLSRAPTTDGYMLNTAYLNYQFEVGGPYIEGDYAGDRDNLLLVQCGRGVSELSAYLERSVAPRSLRTSGAGNGQTLVGAASTGTHGSALQYGAVHDQIIGLLLLTGTNGRVWLERKTKPAASAKMAASLGAELVRDDALFNAALVGFGSFGIIHAALLEVRALTVLESHNKRLPYDGAMKHALDTLDLSGLPLTIGSDAPHGGGEQPYFWQVIVNPFEAQERMAYVTTMFECEPGPDDAPVYALEGGLTPGYDTLSLMGKLTDAAPVFAAWLANLLDGTLISFDEPDRGTFGAMFDYKPPKTKVASFSVFIDAADTSRVLDRIIARIGQTHAPVALVCRYVRQTQSVLGPNRFAMNCAIGVDGVYSKTSSDLFAWIVDDLQSAGIDFTQHWGKDGSYDAATVRGMYGDERINAWKAARNELLSPADRAVFSSAFLERAGLA